MKQRGDYAWDALGERDADSDLVRRLEPATNVPQPKVYLIPFLSLSLIEYLQKYVYIYQ